MDTLSSRVRTLVAEIAPRREPVRGATQLVEDLAFDSVTLLELVVALEDEFEIAGIEEAETLAIRTVEDLEGFVQSRLSGKGVGDDTT